MTFHHLQASAGAAGAALLLVAAAAVYLCAKYVVYFFWTGRGFRRHIAAIERDPAMRKNPQAAAAGNPLVRIFRDAIAHTPRGANDLRAELDFLFHKHFRKVHRAMTLLRLISVISPLLGLMGTVLGIVKVFRVIGAHTAVNPALLATGIWEALVTTIMGLAITIPVLCFYYFFRMQINGFHVELMEYAGRYGDGRPPGGSRHE